MDRSAVHGQGCFLDRLTHARMAVTGARDVLGGAAELHSDHRLCQDVTRQGPKDMDPQHLVRASLGQDLHQAIGLGVGAGARVGGESGVRFPAYPWEYVHQFYASARFAVRVSCRAIG